MNKTVTKQENIESINEPALLSAADCATLCGVSWRTWFRLSASLKTPACVRVGASPRWRLEDLKLWISMDCPDRKEFQARKEAKHVR